MGLTEEKEYINATTKFKKLLLKEGGYKITIVVTDLWKKLNHGPIYPEDLRKSDFDFVLKKLGLSVEDFQQIMNLPIKKHRDYPVDRDIYQRFPMLLLLAPIWKLIKRIKKV